MDLKIKPVILAGGVGTRLWPLSRETFPKQFLRLVSHHSLLQETVLRVGGMADVDPPLIICNAAHYFVSQDHLKEINVSGCQFILEPFGRNTAAAIACAAQWSLNNAQDSILLILPSDHYIADPDLFFEAVNRARTAAERGFLVTFGVAPTHPETGYGYVQAGDPVLNDIYRVKRFIEKPPIELARKLIDAEQFYWNSGMFMFKPQVYLEELKKTAPDIYHICAQTIAESTQQADYLRLDDNTFSACPSISVDYAVMEKTYKAAVIPLASSWNDLGCWEAVAKAGAGDANNNVVRGEVLIQASQNCFVSTEGQMVAALGLTNQIIVSTPDVVLVADKTFSQDVKQIVSQLKSRNSELVAFHKKQYDSTGYTENLAAGDFFSIQHLMLKPFTKQVLPPGINPVHWIVITGTGEIEVNNHVYFLQLHQSCYIEKNLASTLFNKTDRPLHLLCIQMKSELPVSVSETKIINEEVAIV